MDLYKGVGVLWKVSNLTQYSPFTRMSIVGERDIDAIVVVGSSQGKEFLIDS